MSTFDDMLREYHVTEMGVADYTPAAWDRLYQVAADRGTLGTFENFQRKRARMIKQHRQRGLATFDYVFDAPMVDRMVVWCRANGYRTNQAGRAAFGTVMLCEISSTRGTA